MTGDPHCLTPAAELVALRSRVRELEAERDEALKGEADAVASLDANWVQHQRIVAAEQKLAAANALLSDALDALNQDAWPVLADGIRAHLAGQPAGAGR